MASNNKSMKKLSVRPTTRKSSQVAKNSSSLLIKSSTQSTLSVSSNKHARNPSNKASTSSNIVAENAAETEKESLPALPYEVVLKILRLAKAERLQWSHLLHLRRVGNAWRLAVDNFHLPYCYTPASHWSPYRFDKVPEEYLQRSKARYFTFPEDTEYFIELCNHNHNPFPNRELKIWHRYSTPISLPRLTPSLNLIGCHIWSLTYVVGPTTQSVQLLYEIIAKMPFLEDLRVIDNHSTGKPVKLPEITFPSSPPPKLTSLSVIGSISLSPSVLDRLLSHYGKSDFLRCLEVQGSAMKNSQFFNRKDIKRSELAHIKKLKVCGGNTDLIPLFKPFKEWQLTHITFHNVVKFPAPPLSNAILLWLKSFQYTLKELYLYFNNFGKPLRKLGLGNYPNLIRIGIPYRFAMWNSLDLTGCSDLEEIEFHDWCHTVKADKNRVGHTKSELMWADREGMKRTVGRYIRRNVERVMVCYGKTDKVVEEFAMDDYDSDEYYDYSDSDETINSLV